MNEVFFEISMIVAGAALLAWLATISKQPIVIAYLAFGVLAGPWGLGWIKEAELITTISKIGVTLLLFLAGIDLHPRRLGQLFKSAAIVTLVGCGISFVIVFGLLKLFGYSTSDCLYAGIALMFSSTILCLKLLPTTRLHQQHMGAVCIAVLIAQDLLAVMTLLMISGGHSTSLVKMSLLLPFSGVIFIASAFAFEQYVLRKMMRQSDKYHEVLLMLCLGWCLGLAVIAEHVGMSYEVGAFIAGVALARSPMSRFLSEQLKPFRDFFLMFFFFVMGSQLNLYIAKAVWLPALVTGLVIMAIRPLSLGGMFKAVGETTKFAREGGIRLGQASEFGLIIAIAAFQVGRITEEMSQLIQLAVILTMMISSYVVVFSYPTPLGTSADLKQD